MATWNSRGLRGSLLEDLINRSNEIYLEKGLALIQKIPTPITPIQMDKQSRHITLAYFEQKSTVDYIGAVQGVPVFMTEFEKQGGVAFLLIYYSSRDLFYYLTYQDMMKFWNRKEVGGRKSFRMEELDMEYTLQPKHGVFIPYLDGLQKDLAHRD